MMQLDHRYGFLEVYWSMYFARFLQKQILSTMCLALALLLKKNVYFTAQLLADMIFLLPKVTSHSPKF